MYQHTGDNSLNDVNCTLCGQCIEACPTGALHEKETINEVKIKLKDPETYVVVQTAPSVRVALRRRIWNGYWNKCYWKNGNCFKEIRF